NINKNKALSSEIRSAMYIVPNLNTQNEVLKILHKIHIKKHIQFFIAWVKDKLTLWVLSGIS
ncbi:5869_t:CDS:2, partial [Rhizophagus irregularis]